MWNKEKYEQYQKAVESNLAYLSFVSVGACSVCDACGCPDENSASEGHFSWSACESCGSTLGGNRYAAHGREKDGSLNHFEVCEDCVYFLTYGELDDSTMLEINN